ncbi:MAG: hypothetical protein LAO09_17090 [Acidobacteriia bacterium]|nr:hypothetical protein [Terriglobia bacterium]
MISVASKSFPEPAVSEYVGTVFSRNREDLEWLANFIIGDEKIAEACVVDACAQAESENSSLQEWSSTWASMSTIRSAAQVQQQRIAQLSSAYMQWGCIHGGHTALSSDWCDILLEESSVVFARLDVFCRFALVICGLEKRSANEAALLLGVDPASVKGAYCSAIKCLEVISCEQFQRQNDFAAVWN